MQSGLTAVITGASTGIGRALAVLLAKKYKARIALNARNEALLAETAQAVKESGGEAICISGDIADKSVCERLIKSCVESFGSPDMLVNNAGFAKPGPVKNLTLDDWRRVFEVNFFAPVELTYQVLPHFEQKRGCKIVNIASVAGKVAFPGSVCYASTKFALTGFSEGLAAELGPKGIDIITVCPGLVRTEFFKNNRNMQDPTQMAERKDFTGWLMRNFISISSEEAAQDILKALRKGGCQEIVLTKPGVFMERLAGIYPPAAFYLSSFVPSERVK
jgi:short-subunit dehydrogenase